MSIRLISFLSHQSTCNIFFVYIFKMSSSLITFTSSCHMRQCCAPNYVPWIPPLKYWIDLIHSVSICRYFSSSNKQLFKQLNVMTFFFRGNINDSFDNTFWNPLNIFDETFFFSSAIRVCIEKLSDEEWCDAFGIF